MPLLHSPADLLLPSTKTALSFRLVTNLRDLETLAPEWQELLDDSASAEPMLAPNWLLTWWRVYGRDRTLKVGVLRDGERLVGLAPLCMRRHWYRPGIPLTRLEFLGADVDEQDGICSEYLGLIARKGREDEITRRFVNEIHHGSFGHWHELVLGAMNGGDAHPAGLRDAFASLGYRTELTTTTESPYLPLLPSWDAYLKSLPKKRRHNLTSAWRAFEAWAGNEWKIEEARTPEELAQGQAILWELHSQRWQEDGLTGAFAAKRFSTFQQMYMPQLMQAGKLELFWLIVRGQPVAVHYQMATNGKAYYYQCGRRTDVPPKVRIGIVMVSLAIQRAMAQGLREFDFLGGPAFYKTEFTKLNRPIVKLRVARPCAVEWLRGAAERVMGWAREIRRRYRPASPPSG